MRYTIKNRSGEYLHINSQNQTQARSPFYTKDERDSAVFATRDGAEKYMAKNGILGTIVTRTVRY